MARAQATQGKRKSSKSKRLVLPVVDWKRFKPAPIIGCDEVGRGCLAGPVVAAAVILKKPIQGVFFDSKALSEARREELSELIKAEHLWAVGLASVEEIDRINILQASLLAMRRAVQGLKIKTGHVLVDGKFTIPKLKEFSQTALIQGDARVEPISAASIVAKVTRDHMMKALAKEFPQYGFEENKGYGTLRHRRALAEVGPSPHHRLSFAGVDPQRPEV